MLELNKAAFLEKDDWYYRYSFVLISEISELKSVLNFISERETLKVQFA